MPTEDHLAEGERWAFDAEVTDAFDRMLARSIPEYATMRAIVGELGRRFVTAGGLIVDLGCSRGEALAPFVEEHGDGCRYVGCELSDPMRVAATSRFASSATVTILDTDLRAAYPLVGEEACLTLAVLVLQFVPINYRQRIVADAYRATAAGGALIVVEKVLGAGADIDAVLVDAYHQAKQLAGYSAEEVERKRLALEGVLVPVTARWNEELLRDAGFRQVDCFWRCLNFGAWIAVK